MIELHAIIHGRVQLVLFRDFVQRKARALGIKGFVQNRPDGTVEVVAQGDKENLEKLLEMLKRGPLLARVDSIKKEWRTPPEVFSSFNILY